MIALYVSIWVSMVLFAAGESGRAFARRGEAPPKWAWWTFTFGLVLTVVHTILSFAIVHEWNHADAARVTAEQTAAIYGFGFDGAVYVNYVFLATWLADALWWRIRGPVGVQGRWILRAFYLVIIVNAAVVFAAGWRRVLGAVLVSWLVRVWMRDLTTTALSSPRPRSAEDRTAYR